MPDSSRICNTCRLHADDTDTAGDSQRRNFKRCSGCKKVWYCSEECQRADWIRHFYNCQSRQAVTTAHHLARAVDDNSLPQDQQTLVDYGFTKAVTAQAKIELLGVYTDLIIRMKTPPKRLHKWRTRGHLLQETKAAFETLSPQSRGRSYAWLLENEFILDASISEEESQALSKKQRTCNKCGKPEATTRSIDAVDDDDKPEVGALKRCSGCNKVWYCSPECQKRDWVRHIFDCNPRHPITTAHYLALAVHDNLLPQDEQTCDDYGFTRAFTAEARSQLLGVYIGLIERMNISPRTIHKWRIEGRLLQEIKNAFEKLPFIFRGGYYPWLLQNEYVLNTSVPDPREDPVKETMARGLRWAGISVPPSVEEMREVMSRLPQNRQRCLSFCTKILSNWHPAPHDGDDYITFGFCACTCEEEEGYLGVRWHMLLHRCSFEDVCTAYDSSSFLALFSSKGIPIQDPALVDVLENIRVGKSVWDLKQFVIGTDDSNLRPVNSVWADYGFMYCWTDAELLELKGVYKAVFKTANPLELHDACISGKLFEFVERYYKIKDKKREKFTRILKNVYPLSGEPLSIMIENQPGTRIPAIGCTVRTDLTIKIQP